MRRILVSMVCCVAVAQLLNAQSDPWRNWYLARLQPGRQVTVETLPPRRIVKGTFISRDADAITIRLKSGASESLSRQAIGKLTAKRNAYKYAPLIGAAAGATTLGVIASRPRMDFTGTAVAAFAGVGAGIGALAGWAIKVAGDDELIYQAPKR